MENKKIMISILNANFINLKYQIDKCLKNKIDWIHYDVMDFDFVPNLSFGSKILHDIVNEYPQINVDIHFMVKIKNIEIENFFKEFIKCNPKMMTMHIEAFENNEDISKFIKLCKKNNIKSSIAIKPQTSVESIKNYLNQIDNILIMSVEPGFGGQKFIDSVLSKIELLKKIKLENNYEYEIQIDGGINDKTFEKSINAGIDSAVIGSFLLESNDIDFKKRLNNIYNIIDNKK